MKNILFIIILTLSISINAQENNGLVWQTNAQEAINESLITNKPVLMFFTGSDWCGWCIKLQKEVFITGEFIEWASDYILLELDFPKRKKIEPEIAQQNAQLQNMLKVRGYPTVFIIQPEKNENNINLKAIAKSGYVAGGPEKWIESIEKFIKSN